MFYSFHYSVFPGVCVLQIFEYSLVQKEYTQWSRRLQKQGLHSLWLERDTPVTHVSFSSKNSAHIFLHDMFMFCIIDQSLVCEHCLPCWHKAFTTSASHLIMCISVFLLSLKGGWCHVFMSLFPHVAPPWSKGHALQSDDTEESPWAREDQTQPCF